MQRSVEFTGKSEEAAIAAALEELKLSREEVSVEVLQLAKPGFLGIGGTPAKVRVTYEGPDDEPRAVEEAPAPEKDLFTDEIPQPENDEEAAAAVEILKAAQAKDKEPEERVYAAAPEGDPRAAEIVDFLTGLLSRMEIDAAPQVSVDAEGNYLVELVGKDLGGVIGRRGETLDAIQQLTGYAVNHGQSHRFRVRVDAEHYRAKREEALIRMAHRVADKVSRTRRNYTLEPMNAYERHVIHTALQDRTDVTTYSIGTEPNRRTVIAYGQN